MLNIVRTTLDLDDDVLEAARAMSERRGQPLGAVISGLARRSLASSHSETVRNGIHLFPVRTGAGPVTPELVRDILEETK